MTRKLLPVLLAVLLVPATASAATKPQLSDFQLKPANTGLGAKADALGSAGLHKATVDDILRDANRTATSSSGCTSAFAGGALPDRWCWQSDDANTTQWIPQGITNSADAGIGGYPNGRPHAIAVSWYDAKDAPAKGVRVTFINPATGKYRHVLLVQPWTNTKHHASYKPVTVHAGGIAWVGEYLYVADTTNGLRVFDLTRIYDLTASPNGNVADDTKFGRHNNIYYAYGYRYVLPQVTSWQIATGEPKNNGSFKCAASPSAKFSSIAVDHSGKTPYLDSSEYCSSGALGRVAAWPLNANGTLKTGAGGKARAAHTYRLPVQRVQGAVAVHATWYLSQSNGASSAGKLIPSKHGKGAVGVLKAQGAGGAVGIGPEDLSYQNGQNKIWTVTEHNGKRAVYAVPIG
jgi:hypothetical protein